MVKRKVLPIIILVISGIACNFGNILSPFTNTTTISTVDALNYSETLPYMDNFNNPKSGWDVNAFTDGRVGYGNGFYFIESTINGHNMYARSPLNNIKNATIEVDAIPFIGPTNYHTGYGVICRLQPNSTQDGYYFRITGQGYFSVVNHHNGNFYSMTNNIFWIYSLAINKGKVTNHISVTCDGNHLTFIVNGTTLFEANNDLFTTGSIGLTGVVYEDNVPAEIHFTNFNAKNP